MADYIDREQAIEAAYQGLKRPNEDPKWIDICENLKAVPAADVKPVVLCRNCKYWGRRYASTDYRVCALGVGVEHNHFSTPPDGFCAWGERGNDNDD